ncbi:MAG: hypothetical protein HC922_07600 [Leptolyngbyaceae cyanobacterium SM2_3_12]|nr:hypothetical protein [Leptolyngbyaceae cyanobacterium SM2_3_12]
MKIQTLRFLLSSLLLVGLAEAAVAAEATSLELTSDTPALADQELVQGPVRVVVSYQPIDFDAEPEAGAVTEGQPAASVVLQR